MTTAAATTEQSNEVQVLLERLWCLSRHEAGYDVIERALSKEIRENPHLVPRTYFKTTAGDAALLLWHLCANGCSFDIIMRTHFQNESACREVSAGSLPLHEACRNECSIQAINFLMKQFPQARYEVDEEMNSPLHLALLNHTRCAELVPILQTPSSTLPDLTVPCGSFPLHVLDALVEVHDYRTIALETTPISTQEQEEGQSAVVFASSRFHVFCPELQDSLQITVSPELLQTTLDRLATYRIPLMALNMKCFQEFPLNVAKIPTLSHLFLQRGNIRHDDFCRMLQALSVKPNFSRLHIRSSPSLRGITSPALSLSLTNLRHLDLGCNEIGPSLAEPLSLLLESTSTLTLLDIGGNQIGTTGMQRIYQALRVNRSVERLEVVGECTDGLVVMLSEFNMTIQHVRLLGLLARSHDSELHRDQVDFWCKANRCGRAKLHETATKREVFSLLHQQHCNERRTSEAMGIPLSRISPLGDQTREMIGICYALLRTNPELWSK